MTNIELKKDLNSKNTAIISKALHYISENGNHEIIPDLILLLENNNSDSIKEQLIRIFEDLHDQRAVPYLINAISDKKYKNIRGLLVSACWKNSLNFEDYIELFTDIFIESDFTEAFDALTVIDNMYTIAEEKANKCIIKLEFHLEDAVDLKKSIISELIKIIHSHIKNPAD
jgi:HEAT repeat protein